MPRNSYHNTPVVEFHEAFGAPVAWGPTMPARDRQHLRAKLIFEEFQEFLEACGLYIAQGQNGLYIESIAAGRPDFKQDLVSAADALTDLRYVIDGACLEFGLPGEQLLAEVHRSNMSKLGPDNAPLLREDGKILKGPNYTPPDLKKIIDYYLAVRAA